MKTISVYEARNRFSQLLRDAAAGEEIIVVNRGEPVARITGVPQSAPNGRKNAAFAEWLINNPIPAHLGRTEEEIDRAIEEERNAWD